MDINIDINENRKKINKMIKNILKRKRGKFSSLDKIMQKILNKSKKEKINILQVGANDGKINDPLNRFLIKNKRKTKALLVEPQLDIIPFLEKSYKNHPNVTIFNGAVGKGKKLTLFRLKPKFWKYYNEPSFRNVPSYRAPSGIASSNREFVIEHIKRRLKYAIPAEEAIEKIDVPCKTVESLARLYLNDSVDILQIDTEGFDDKVIYSCDLRKLKPLVISYEYKHLGKERNLILEKHLKKNGYNIIEWSRGDRVAVLSSISEETGLKINDNQNKKLLVTIATADRLDWAKQLFSAAHFKGGWQGDYMLLAYDVPEKQLQCFKDRGILVKNYRPTINKEILSNSPSVLSKLNKFYLFTLEFKKWDNIVYLDSDIFIRASINALGKIKGFAACPDYNYNLKTHFINLKNNEIFRDLKNKYKLERFAFNSGVLAFSTDIINNNSYKKLIKLYSNYQTISHKVDQPILNLYFYKKWKKLSLAYNVPFRNLVSKNKISKKTIKGIMIHVWCSNPKSEKDFFYDEMKENIRMFKSIKINEKNTLLKNGVILKRSFIYYT